MQHNIYVHLQRNEVLATLCDLPKPQKRSATSLLYPIYKVSQSKEEFKWHDIEHGMATAFLSLFSIHGDLGWIPTFWS